MPNLPFQISQSSGALPNVPAAAYRGSGLAQFGGAIQQAGSVVQEARDRLFDAEQQSVYYKTMTDETIRLRERTTEIQQGDFREAEAAFDKEAKASESAGAGLRGPRAAQFRNQMNEVVANERMKLTGWVNGRQLDETRANRDSALIQMRELASKATSEGERDLWRQNALGLLESTVLGGVTDAVDAVKMAVEFEADINSADLINLVNFAPAQAFSALADPNGKFRDMPEITRQQWLGKAQDAYRADVAAQFTAERRMYLDEKRARVAAKADANAELHSIMSENDVGYITPEDASRRAEALGDDANGWMELAVKGGRYPANPQDNPSVVIAMSEVSASGENVRPVLDYYLSQGMLRLETRNSLLAANEKNRFSPARKWLAEVAKPRTPFGGTPSAQQIQSSADAVMELETWVQQNPNASASEAETRAREIGKRIVSRAKSTAGLMPNQGIPERRVSARTNALARLGVPRGTTPNADQLREIEGDAVYLAELMAIKAAEQALLSVGEP